MLSIVLVSLTAMAFAGGGAFNLAGTEATQRDFARWGYPRWWCRVTGLLEIAAAVLVARPKTRGIGLVSGALIVLAAATVARRRDVSHLRPIGAFIVLLVATAALSGH